MTTYHRGYTVALEENIREDDAEPIVTALRMIRGVIAVTPIKHTPSDGIAETRARHALEEKLWEALRPKGGR